VFHLLISFRKSGQPATAARSLTTDRWTSLQSDQNYAARVSHAADDAHRPPLHGFAAAARAAPGTDRQTDGHGTVLVSK